MMSMNSHAVLGLSALLSLVASVVAASLFVWPRLWQMDHNDALVSLVAPHMFLRFIGLSFLVHGVVSPALPADFATPNAYGDLVAGILAIVPLLRLRREFAGPSRLCGCSTCGAPAICSTRFIREMSTRKLIQVTSALRITFRCSSFRLCLLLTD